MRRRLRTAAAVSALAVATACGRLGVPEPATDQGSYVLDLWKALFVAAAGLGAVVLGLAVFAAVRFRRRAGDDELPHQSHGNPRVEIVYVAVPLLVVMGFFGYILWVEDQTDEADGAGADVSVEVTGYRWGWRFEYPDLGVTVEAGPNEVPEMVLPTGDDVRLALTTDDVIHSYFVPEFLTKRDLIPGIENVLHVRPTREGSYTGYCAEFCGLDHAGMLFSVRVVSPDEFDSWVTAEQARVSEESQEPGG